MTWLEVIDHALFHWHGHDGPRIVGLKEAHGDELCVCLDFCNAYFEKRAALY